MSYRFQTFAFDTRDQLLDAMVAWYWNADGANTPADIDAEIADLAVQGIDAATKAADDLMLQLGLADEPFAFPWETPEPSHMAANGYDRDDLIAAARRFIDTRPDKIEDADE
jgi:hypothetical protein